MIATIIILILEFAWLFYESDFLRIRLPVGIAQIPEPPELYISNKDIRSFQLRSGYKSWLGILCGWEWAIKHEHDLDNWHPTIELHFETTRYKMSFNNGNGKLLGEIMKTMLAPHKPKTEIYPPSHYRESGLGCWRSTKIKSLKGLELAPS